MQTFFEIICAKRKNALLYSDSINLDQDTKWEL